MPSPDSAFSSPSDLVVTLTDDHRYIRIADGHEVDSVSKILRLAGIRPKPIVRGIRGEALAAALLRGREVHRLTRAIDETFDEFDALDDVFDPADFTYENADYVAAYQRFLRDSGYRPLAWEKVLYHPVYDYAGRADGIGWLDVRRVLIDRKTERRLHTAVWLQLAAYREAWNYWHPTAKIDQTYAVVLHDDTTFDLVPNPLEPGDFPFFVGAIWVAKWHRLVL